MDHAPPHHHHHGEGTLVWLAASDVQLAPPSAGAEHAAEGVYQGRRVGLQSVADPDTEVTEDRLRQLESLYETKESVANVLGFYRSEADHKVYAVYDWPASAVSLREYLQDKNRDIPWKERAEIASEVAETEKAVHSATVIDPRSMLIDKRSKKIQLTGFRIKDESSESDTSADFGRFLVELIAREPARPAPAGSDSIVDFPQQPLALESPRATSPRRHSRMFSANALVTPPESPRASLGSSSSGVHLSPRGASSPLDLSSSGSYARKDASTRERNWEKVQVKAFTAWLNSYLARRDLKIVDLQNDLQDGTLLNSFLEIITNKKMRRWTAKPNSKIKMLENLSFGLTYIQHDMGVKLVGIGSEDIYNGSLKLILGLVWSLLKGIQMRRFATEGSMEEELIKWARERTEALGVAPSNFKYGFQDGKAFAAIVSRFDSTLLDFEAIRDKAPEDLLPLVFDIAEEHMGVPRLLEPSEMLSGDPDERAIQLYVSLLFDAFSLRKETAEFSAIAEVLPADELHPTALAPIQIPADCPPALLELAKQCCRAKPEDRPSLNDIRRRLRSVIADITAHPPQPLTLQVPEVPRPTPAPVVEKKANDDELDRLKKLLAERENEIKALKQQLEKNEGKGDQDQQDKPEEAKERNEEMGTAIARLRETEAQLKQREDEMVQLRQQHENELAEREMNEGEEKRKLDAERLEAEKEARKLSDELLQLSTASAEQIKEKEEEIERLHKRQEERERENEERLEEERRKHELELNEVGERERKLEHRVKESEDEVARLSSDAVEAAKLKAQLEKRLEETLTERLAENEQRSALTASWLAQIEQLKAEKEEIADRLREEWQAKVDATEQRLQEESRAEIARIEKQRDALEAAIEKLEEREHQLKKEFEERESQLADTAESEKHLREQAEQRKKESEDELARLKAEANEAAKREAQLVEQRDRLEAERRAKGDEAMQELERARAEAEEIASEELAAAQAKSVGLASQLDRLKSQQADQERQREEERVRAADVQRRLEEEENRSSELAKLVESMKQGDQQRLEEKLAERERQLREEFEERMGQAQKEREECRAKEIEDEVARLRSEADEAAKREAQLVEQRDRIEAERRAEGDEAKQELERARVEAEEKAREELAAAQARSADLARQLDQLKNQLSDSTQQAEEERSKVVELKRQLDEERSKAAELERQRDEERDKAAADAAQQLEEERGKVVEAAKQLEEEHQRADDLERQLEAMREQRLEEKLEERERQLREAFEERNDHDQKEIEELSRRAKENEDEVARLRAESGNAAEREEKAREELAQAQAKLADLDKAAADAALQLEEEQNRSSELEKLLKAMKEGEQRLEKKLEEREHHLREEFEELMGQAQKAKEEAERRAKENEDEVARLRAEANETAKREAHLTQEHDNLKQRLDETQAERQNQHDESKSAHELDEARAISADLASQLEAAKSEAAELERRLQEERSRAAHSAQQSTAEAEAALERRLEEERSMRAAADAARQSEHEELEARLEKEFEERVARIREEAERQAEERKTEDVQAEQRAKGEELEELGRRAKENEDEVARLMAEAAKAAKRESQLAQERDGLAQRLNETLAEHQNRGDNDEASARELEEQTRMELDKARAMSTDLASQLETAKSEAAAELERRLEEERGKATELERRLEEERGKATELGRRLEEERSKATELERRLEEELVRQTDDARVSQEQRLEEKLKEREDQLEKEFEERVARIHEEEVEEGTSERAKENADEIVRLRAEADEAAKREFALSELKDQLERRLEEVLAERLAENEQRSALTAASLAQIEQLKAEHKATKRELEQARAEARTECDQRVATLCKNKTEEAQQRERQLEKEFRERLALVREEAEREKENALREAVTKASGGKSEACDAEEQKAQTYSDAEIEAANTERNAGGLEKVKQELNEAWRLLGEREREALEARERKKERRKAEKEELLGEIEQMKRDARSQQGELDESEQNLARLREELEQYQQAQSDRLGDIGLEQADKQLAKEQAEDSEVVEELRRAVAKAERDRCAAEGRMDEMTRELERLRSQKNEDDIGEARAKAREAEEKARFLRLELDLLEYERAQQDAANEQLRRRLEDMEADDDQLRRRLERGGDRFAASSKADLEEDLLTRLQSDVDKMRSISRQLHMPDLGCNDDADANDGTDPETRREVSDDGDLAGPVALAERRRLTRKKGLRRQRRRPGAIAAVCVPGLWTALAVALLLLLLLLHKADFIKEWWVPT